MRAKRTITIEVPDGMEHHDAAILVRDALSDFISKRQNARAYVERGYGDTTLANLPGWFESKVSEVLSRVNFAEKMLSTVRSTTK